MNILIIPSWYGTESNPQNGSFFREQAIELKKAGHNVIVAFVEVTLKDLSTDENKVKIYVDEGVKTYTLKVKKIPKTGNVGTALAMKKGLLKIYKEIESINKIDIIHLHSCIWGGIGAAAISKRYSIPLVITEHSSYYSRFKLNSIENYFVKRAVNRCSVLVCVSNALKKKMQKYKGKIEVIPNMVDCSKFKVTKLKASNEFTFLTISYLNPNKRVDLLIRAFKNEFSGDENRNVKLVIGGEGSESNNLKNLVKELNLENKVEFLGDLSREEVPSVISSCNVFVLPSKVETFGVVLIEALASGKPVISTKNGGAEDIITKENGIIIDTDNYVILGEAMRKMMLDYNNYDSIKISEECKGRYNKQAITVKLEKLYLTCIK